MDYPTHRIGRPVISPAPSRFRLRPPPGHLPAGPEPPVTPEHPAGEVVVALECGYGSFGRRPGSSAVADLVRMHGTGATARGVCERSTESPWERYDCPYCGGSYCVAHADRDAHDCRTVIRGR